MKTNNKLSLLFNPFTKIAGSKALIVGLIVIILTVIIGHSGGIIFNGVFDIHLSSAKLQLCFVVQFISLAILILTLFVAAKILSKTSFRFIDVAGTILLSRTPFVLLSLVALLLPTLASSSNNVSRSLMGIAIVPANAHDWTVFIGFTLLCVIVWLWFATLVYNAIAESCNLRGVRAIIATTSGLLIAEIVAAVIIFFVLTASLSTAKPGDVAQVSTTQVESNLAYDDINQIALNLAEEIKNKNYKVLIANFDSEMKTAMPETKLEQVMLSLENEYGEITQIETEVTNEQHTNFRVAFVPLHYKEVHLRFKFVFDTNNQIAGFFIVAL